MNHILWPPDYYILRDRIPFFLTIIYLYRHRLPPYLRDALGQSLLVGTSLLMGLSIGLFIKGQDMQIIAGIHWSFPSPIEWSLLTITSAVTLYHRNLELYESYYMAVIASVGGGWVYEIIYSIPHWINSGFAPWNWLKINAVKVFFMEFQVLCIPILLYIIKNTKKYETPRLLVPLIAIAIIFYGLGPAIAPYIHRLGKTAYMWSLRVPTQLVLYTLLYGVKGDKT